MELEVTPTSGEKIFICGPIEGIEGHNAVLFKQVELALIQLGYEVVNPHELQREDSDNAMDEFRQDIQEMLLCDKIAVLPGWSESRSACSKIVIAQELGIELCTIKIDNNNLIVEDYFGWWFEPNFVEKSATDLTVRKFQE